VAGHAERARSEAEPPRADLDLRDRRGQPRPLAGRRRATRRRRPAGRGSRRRVQTLRDTWFTDRADARSRILVYFPGLYTCWYSFDHAVADYLSLGAGDRSQSRIASLEAYVDGDFANSYVDRAVPDGCRPLAALPSAVQSRFEQLKAIPIWKNLALRGDDRRSTSRFRNAYAVLAEEMDIAMERVVDTIVKAHAQGFSHGIFAV
jgi:hypothetical protein